MKTVLRRTVSLVMCALLLLQMVPAVSVHVHAEEGDVAYWEATYYMTGEMVDGATYLLVGKRETETDEGTVMSCWVLDFTGNTLELPSDSYDAASDTVTLSADLANSVKLTCRAETQMSEIRPCRALSLSVLPAAGKWKPKRVTRSAVDPKWLD